MFFWAALAEVATFTVLGLAFPRGPWSWDAATVGPASLIAPVSGTYPILATFGAAAVLKERLPPRVLAALLVFGGGIALVAWA